jgi:ketosteroid isomerase-like protein
VKSIIRYALAAACLAIPASAPAQVSAELDEYWAELARTVQEGDFEGYSALYHPDAVLVMQGSGTAPIGTALAAWKQGFDDTREGRAAAGVEFRFTQRLNGETTAHETGMFHYTLDPENGDEVEALVWFEALLVKRDGRWLMVMEFQKDAATESDWAAAK